MILKNPNNHKRGEQTMLTEAQITLARILGAYEAASMLLHQRADHGGEFADCKNQFCVHAQRTIHQAHDAFGKIGAVV